MNSRRKEFFAAVVAAAASVMLISSASASAAAFNCNVPLDNFNRADSGTLGTNWTTQAGTMVIENNSATNPSATTGLATWNSVPPTQQACADVSDNGATTQYAALTLGFGSVTDDAFVKVQDNTASGSFDTAYIYYGNNGTCKIAGGCAFPVSPFHAARLYASLNPATAEITLDIDTNFDNVPEQSITKTYSAPYNFGNAIGVGAYGHSFVDNFATVSAPTPTPTPTPSPTPISTPISTPKPLKCKKGFKKVKVNGKYKCVKRHKKHGKHKKH